MAFDTLALIFASFMGVPGILFMMKNTATAQNAATEAKISVSPKQLALAAYYLCEGGEARNHCYSRASHARVSLFGPSIRHCRYAAR